MLSLAYIFDILKAKRATLSDTNFEKLTFMKENDHHVETMEIGEGAEGQGKAYPAVHDRNGLRKTTVLVLTTKPTKTKTKIRKKYLKITLIQAN